MGKIVTVKIDRFDGGIVNDIRSKENGRVRALKNFDATTYPHRLVPHRDSESGDNFGASTNHAFANFLYAESKLFGLGIVDGTSKPKIFYKTTYTDGAWTTPTNGEGTVARDTECFVYYKIGGVGYIFLGQSGRLSKFAADGSAFTDSERSISHTTIAQGLVHSKDDILYIPYDNKIAKNNAGSWTDAALTLPSDVSITSICEYGNYLAIATSHSYGVSTVYLWDRDSSLTTLAEKISWGNDYLCAIAELNGSLIGISYNSENVFYPDISVRKYDGYRLTEIAHMISSSVSTPLRTRLATQKYNQRIYFTMSLGIDGTTYDGVWSIGKASSSPLYSLVFEYVANNDTSISSLGAGFFISGDYTFITYNDGAGNDTTSKTNDSAIYTATTSVCETLKYDLDDASLSKKLIGVSVTTAPLPSAGQVVLKYKTDAESSWTTIFTNSTDNSISHSSVNIESTGANLPEFKEIQFRIESTGGAEITGLSFDCEVMDKRPY